MANIFDKMFQTPNFNPADPIRAQERQLERRRQAARQMIEQSMRQNPSEMVGGGGGGGRWQARPGILVPGNSLGTAIAQGAAGYMAGRENQAIDKAELDAARQREAQHRDWLARQPGGAAGAAAAMPSQGGTTPPPGMITMEQQNAMSGGKPPMNNSISNNLLMLMGDENKAAMEAADNEAAMLQFGQQPGKFGGEAAGASANSVLPSSGTTSYANPQAVADDDGTIRMGVTRHEGDLRAEVDAQMARNQQMLDNPTDADRAYMHPALTATAPTDLPPQGGTEPAQPPQDMTDRDQLRWLLEGAMLEAPGANLLLNQAGNNLLTGEAKREAAMQVLQTKGQQQMELAAARAEVAMANARTKAEQAEVQRQWQAEQNQIYKNTAAEIARHNRAMENRPVGGAAAGGKALSASQEKAIEELASNRNAIGDLASTFRDNYSGSLVDSAQGKAGEFLGGMAPQSVQDQTRWWSDFRQFYELPVRHSMFGAALTPHEAASWKASSITPNLAPAEIRKRLATLQNIYDSAITRKRESLRVSGKNVDQFDALTKPMSNRPAAPDSALDYLRNNPQFAPQFKAKYGYLPEGF